MATKATPAGAFGRVSAQVSREVWSAVPSVDPKEPHDSPAPAPRPLTRRVAGSPTHRDPAAYRDRRRVAARRRRDRGDRAGQLPRGGRLHGAARHARGPRGAAPQPVARIVGGRRPARGLLLPRGPGAETRVRRRRPPRTAPRSRARRGRGGRRPAAGADLRRVQRDASGRPGRLGHPDRDRHRVRRRGTRRHRLAPAERAADLPADAGGRRRPHRDHDHRGRLHERDTRA